MAQARNRRQYYPSELGAATSCPPSSEGAGRKRTPAMEHRAVLRPYLHGMEEAIGVKYDYRGQLIGKRAVVRYADDFVCFCETKEDAERVQGILTEWLKERGLTLSEEKTRIVHLTEGFDFLGFNIRHYPAPKTSRTGWKLLIKPSKEAVQDMRTKLSVLWEKAHGMNVQTVLGKLNPVIRGWANYFRTAVAKEIFSGLDC